MKVAHFCVFAPYANGQCGSVRDLIQAEKLVGIDAGFIDYGYMGKPESRVGLKDDNLETLPVDWATDADLIIRHSAIPPEIDNLGTPVITALHGRPEGSFLLEYYGKTPIIKELSRVKKKSNHAGFLNFWREHLFQWSQVLGGEEVFYIPAPIDVSRHEVKNLGYKFGGKFGSPNIIIADTWREDITPYNILMAAAYFKAYFEYGAKVHIYGVPKNTPIDFLKSFVSLGILGEVSLPVRRVSRIFSSADILLTSFNVVTRVVREAMASRLPFVAGGGCRHTPFSADPRDIEGYAKEIARCWNSTKGKSVNSREILDLEFGLRAVGDRVRKVFESILDKYKRPLCEIPKKVSAKENIKLAIVYDKDDHKLQDTSYSWIYKGMLDAVIEKFGDVTYIHKDCCAADIEADAILFYDIHSSHHIRIDGIRNHPAVKLEYFSDPNQEEVRGFYKQFNKPVHKLGRQQRTERAIERGVRFIISPCDSGYHKWLGDFFGKSAEDMLLYFPLSPTLPANKPPLLSERNKKVLGNGSTNGEQYTFRRWAFEQPYIDVVPHWIRDNKTPSGPNYVKFLMQYAGVLGLHDYFPCPKYFEIPVAGCVLFAKHYDEFGKLGFKDYEHCVYVNKENFERRIRAFLSDTQPYQDVADAGRKLVEDNYTAKHFADFVHNTITDYLCSNFEHRIHKRR